MHLQGIYLENFKSFGKKIYIPFLKGFTAVTGPNGSGKSNICDAILFVLGPKSPKVIRAGKLTDLMFNGGKDRKPATYCKATLSFENKDRVIPVDNDEVKLTRVLKYSQTKPENYYSYFYINGKVSSLQEFDEVLAGARISADGYNLIQQGDVNRFTTMTPMERRKILDDIAGISKYEDEIKKAEEKRKGVEENLTAIGIRMEEIVSRLKQLENERSSALKYTELKEKCTQAKAMLLYKRKDSFDREIKLSEEHIKRNEEESKIETEKLEEKAKLVAKKRIEINELENKIAELGGEEEQKLKERIDEVRLAYFRARDGIETSKENIKNLRNEKAKLENEIKGFEKEITGHEKRIEVIKEETARNENERLKIENSIKETEKLISRTDTKALSLQREIVIRKKEVEERQKKKNEFLLEIERIEDRIKRIELEIAQQDEAIKRYEFQIKDYNFEISELKKGIKSKDEERKKIEEKLMEKKNLEKALIEKYEKLENDVRNLRREYETLKAQASAVALLKKGYTAAVESILELRDKGALKGIHGTIAELGSVEKKYETALSVAAGQRMQSIIVENDSVGAEGIEFLKKKGVGRAAFLPLNKMISGRPGAKALMAVKNESAIGFGIDLVKYEQKYAPAFWHVFGDTIVVKDLDSARKLMGGVRLVTLSGELIEHSGAMIGGTLESGIVKFGEVDEKNVISAQSRLRDAIDELESLTSSLQEIRKEIVELEKMFKGIDISAATPKIADLEFKKKEYELSLANLKKEKEKNVVLIDKTNEENLVKKRELKECEEVIGVLEKEIEDKAKLLSKETPQQIAKKMKDWQDSLAKLLEYSRNLRSEEETLATKLKLIKDRKSEVERRIGEIEKGLVDEKGRGEKLREDMNAFENEMNALMEMQKSSANELISVRKKRDECYKEITLIERDIEKIKEKIETYSDMIIQLKANIRMTEEKMVDVLSELQNYKFEVKGKLPTIEELTNKIKECEASMQTLEPVNMLAIEEYATQEKRKNELEEELKKLSEQKEDLIKIVEEINSKKKFGLLKVFNAINENFKTIYKELAGGGSAELILENPENPTEGGLIVKAQPKDGKVMRLEALSGGQKSLTALSFIFAIQQYMPSPFYLLDELDMNLDSINSENVAKMIKRNSELSQFVAITLRKVTMKEADHIYGVTKQKNGISEIVGNVNISDLLEG